MGEGIASERRTLVLKLDHVNIRTTQPEATRDFFVDVVGLREGERPPFNFGGYWLYAGDQAVIHLTDTRGGKEHGAEGSNGGAGVDHIAFRMSGYARLCDMLEGRGVPFETRIVPRNGDVQVFLNDPNGVGIELTFPASEGSRDF
jgi:catechol 2,3-dioxygenase-like lactoylglutathione lyase family enzyme